MKKERLDKYLTDLGYFETKSKAAACILAGDVKINDERITKSGFQIDITKNYEIEIKSMPFVSRGGLKLQKALNFFNVNPNGRICFDAGASTGGFTDCLLQLGAEKVYAVDVGYGQLAWKIRNNVKVKTIEKTNIRICNFEDIYDKNDKIADLLVMDISFISITKVLENLKKFLAPNHEMLCLIKPQFEAGKELIEKGGIVTDKKVHKDVIEKVINSAKNLDYKILGLTYSPIKGPSGNIEYLIHISTSGENIEPNKEKIIDEAFANL